MKFEVPDDKIMVFCRKWHISEMSLFGSALRDDFTPDSDIDVLVRFDESTHCSLFDLVHIENELKEIFGRDVDLVSKRGIEASRNYVRREAILNSAKVIYAA